MEGDDYSENAAINDCVLAIINDGNGELCGLTYERRAFVATGREGAALSTYRIACRHYGRYARRHEGRELTAEETETAARLILDYYVSHNAELAKGRP